MQLAAPEACTARHWLARICLSTLSSVACHEGRGCVIHRANSHLFSRVRRLSLSTLSLRLACARPESDNRTQHIVCSTIDVANLSLLSAAHKMSCHRKIATKICALISVSAAIIQHHYYHQSHPLSTLGVDSISSTLNCTIAHCFPAIASMCSDTSSDTLPRCVIHSATITCATSSL